MSLVWRSGFQFDEDASAYILAVEQADGQQLEAAVRYAINDFVLRCKADGIWSAIKASCILAGARTLAGALVPLAGSAPTNFNFVAGDYNRKTGLVGDGSTKYLDSNRNNNADPQNSKHVCVFASSLPTSAGRPMAGMVVANATGSTLLYSNNSRLNDGTNSAYSAAIGFTGLSRGALGSYERRTSGSTSTILVNSASPVNGSIALFRDGGGAGFFGNPRLAFYSIGESLDLALLGNHVTTLINQFAAVIP